VVVVQTQPVPVYAQPAPAQPVQAVRVVQAAVPVAVAPAPRAWKGKGKGKGKAVIVAPVQPLSVAHVSRPAAAPPGGAGAPSAPLDDAAPPAEDEGLVLQVVIPDGVGPGTQLGVEVPDVGQVTFEIPQGVGPGAEIQLWYDSSSSTLTPMSCPRSDPVWEFGLSGGGWKAFEPEHQPELESAYSRGDTEKTIKVGGPRGDTVVVVNFKSWTQQVRGSDRKRQVRRRE
jgi:hypothetical protein